MKKMRRAMPIGVDDFSELITKNYCFVDKTRFIKEILGAIARSPLSPVPAALARR